MYARSSELSSSANSSSSLHVGAYPTHASSSNSIRLTLYYHTASNTIAILLQISPVDYSHAGSPSACKSLLLSHNHLCILSGGVVLVANQVHNPTHQPVREGDCSF
jgi:hypothetical protein